MTMDIRKAIELIEGIQKQPLVEYKLDDDYDLDELFLDNGTDVWYESDGRLILVGNEGAVLSVDFSDGYIGNMEEHTNNPISAFFKQIANLLKDKRVKGFNSTGTFDPKILPKEMQEDIIEVRGEQFLVGVDMFRAINNEYSETGKFTIEMYQAFVDALDEAKGYSDGDLPITIEEETLYYDFSDDLSELEEIPYIVGEKKLIPPLIPDIDTILSYYSTKSTEASFYEFLMEEFGQELRAYLTSIGVTVKEGFTQDYLQIHIEEVFDNVKGLDKVADIVEAAYTKGFQVGRIKHDAGIILDYVKDVCEQLSITPPSSVRELVENDYLVKVSPTEFEGFYQDVLYTTLKYKDLRFKYEATNHPTVDKKLVAVLIRTNIEERFNVNF